VRQWNATAVPYPRNRSIHDLFEEQVVRSPNATAVRFRGESITYHELNARANKLAHYLRSVGVTSEVLVGIYIE
jgi:non-ribosomal peptide synthetase component F